MDDCVGKAAYKPKHHNEGLVIVEKATGIAVREYPGGPGRLAKLSAAVKTTYLVMYVGEYLAQLNTKRKDEPNPAELYRLACAAESDALSGIIDAQAGQGDTQALETAQARLKAAKEAQKALREEM